MSEASTRRGVGHDGPVERDGPSGRAWLIGVITVVLVGWALKATMLVTMPIAFAFFVALVVWPVDGWVRARVPKRLGWLGHVAAMLAILAVILAFVAGLYFVARSVASELPTYADQLRGQLDDLRDGGAEGTLRGALANAIGSAGDGASGLVGFVGGFAQRILRSLGTTLSLVVLIFFFALIMLTEAGTWRAKLEAVTAGKLERDWEGGTKKAAESFRWYLWVRTLLAFATAVLYGLWLFVFGVEFVWVWIVLTFLLGYVPTLGSLISGILPFAFALATKDFGTAMIVGAGLFVIEQVMGNYVDPKLQGRELSLSPLVILFSLLLWSYIWGVAGALIAVPMTVLMVIAFARIDALRPVALMLSDATSYDELDENVVAG